MRCLARGFGTAQEGESIQRGAIQGAQEENTALGEVARRKRNTPLSIRKEQRHHSFLHTGGGIGHQDFGASPQGRLLPQPPHCHSQPSGPSRLRLVSGLCRVGGCRGTALALSHTLLPFFRFCFTFFFFFFPRGKLNIYHASGVALTNFVFLAFSPSLCGL